ncbi:AfsR/SARP family transcriptional regulator [Actinospica sp.]|uniref:AfsR/SARP family transcriptional regulator n=1 Tax=Actinospica sp. TaxID=1872142 RepID=UPI002C77E2E5|nr:BTAD domain-containing putative transcriptional regulator [Actinospica sp.]HWG25934.1 BTAD domain-containing putative transcriptional regulator [Actinospica sp.]
MRFGLLGPLQVRSNGADVPIRGTLRRTLLAALLLNRGAVVSADRLSELLWGDDAADAVTPLYNQVMRLRQALDDDGALIRAVPPGYLIHVAPDDLDLTEFTDLCARARDAAATSDWLDSAKLYTAALALWRGEMLADVPALHDHPSIHQLTEDHLVAVQGRIEADLNLGRHDELIGELRTLTKSHPLREAFHAQLMLALYRAGRQADALSVYRDLRSASSSELGVEPGAAIQALHSAILNSDPSLALTSASALAPTAPAPAPRPPMPSPRQLPADTRLFTGRQAELDELTSLALNGNPTAGTVVISAINGMGGVGKTALAIHAAHQLHERYPDGQLFIDLHGYSVDLDPVAPEDALDYLLRSLGVPPQSIPGDPDARTALYRSRLAASRTLILLDNAVNAAQVRPLLPAAPGCLVLITSRNRLTSLDDAHLLALDVLPHADAVALLRDVAGPTRAPELDAQPTAVAELITLCAHTPLAIRIVAARLRHRTSLTVDALNTELREEADRLDRIQDGDRDLTTVFNASLRMLPDPAQRLFRLLGLIPGPDFDPHAAAHLAATDLRTAERHLDTLLDHNLLIQHAPGRYRLHDLLRAHARTLAAQDPGSEAAFTRLVDYYLVTERAADAVINSKAKPMTAPVLSPKDPLPVIRTGRDANDWLRTERQNLLALVAQPTTDPVYRDALISALATHLGAEGPWSLAEDLHASAAESARIRGDQLAEANALVDLGTTAGGLGKPDVALDHLERASALYRKVGNARGEARTLWSIGHTNLQRGRMHMAAKPYKRALEIYRELGDRSGTAALLSLLGVQSHATSKNKAAKEYFAQAIAIRRELNHAIGEADCLLNASFSLFATEDFDEVRPSLHRALTLAKQALNRQLTANILQEIGRYHLLAGELDDATRLFSQALELHVEVGFRMGEGNIYWERGRIEFARGNHDGAMELYFKALDIFLEIRNLYGETLARHELGRAHHARGEFERAKPLLDRALQINVETGFQIGEAEVRNSIAALRADVDGPEVGLKLYQEAHEVAVRAEHPLERARGLEGMARCEVELGMVEAGVGHLREAVDLYGRMKVVEYRPAAAWLTELTGG